MQKFWNLVLPDEDEKPAELYLEGEIASETWYGDEVTPAAFRAELAKASGRDVTVWINSPGGDVFAASVIYTALMEHKGRVNVRIEGLAASAASVVAMAGDTVSMAPTAYLMIHNPWTLTVGSADDLRHEADVLDEVADGIILAYQIKTGLSRNKLREMMADETWMSARTAIDLGFADELISRSGDAASDAAAAQPAARAHCFGRIAACAKMRQRIAADAKTTETAATQAERDTFLAHLREVAGRHEKE